MGEAPKIHFINRVDRTNVGDWYCSPLNYYYNYFKNYNIVRHDIEFIRWLDVSPYDVVIMGASGVLNMSDSFQQSIQRLCAITPNVIAWGVGFNTPTGRTITAQLDFTLFRAIGIRDYNHPSGLQYLPCVSCLAPELTKKSPIKREIGIIDHPVHAPINGLPYEKIGNSSNLHIITDFIASSEVIFTSSYHMVIWATMMGKRVVCAKPWSDKFSYFKHKPIFYSGNLKEDISLTTVYGGVLTESIQLNNDFFAKIKKIIMSTVHAIDPSYQRLHEINRYASIDLDIGFAEKRAKPFYKKVNTLQNKVELAVSDMHNKMELAVSDMHMAETKLHARIDDILTHLHYPPKIALCFGTGNMMDNILPTIRQEYLTIKAFIDERPGMHGKFYAGSPIIDSARIMDCAFDYILVACRPSEFVVNRLQKMEIPSSKIIVMDFENLIESRNAQNSEQFCTAVTMYLQKFPGVVQAVDISALLRSAWLKEALANKKKSIGFKNMLLSDFTIDMPCKSNSALLLSELTARPVAPQRPEDLTSIHIETTNLCDYRCFCCTVWKTHRPKGVISVDSLHVLTSRLKNYSGEVALNYCGEPLQDKALPQKIRILRDAWPQATLTFVSTLGECIDGAMEAALWENGLNRLDVSFYGYTPELYEKIHGVARFDTATQNLRRVLESENRTRLGGKVRVRVLHIEEQASFVGGGYADAAMAFRSYVDGYPGASTLDTYLMSQAGASHVSNKRGTQLPCSIAWGAFARTLFVTWELDVSLCCATTGDEIIFGNLHRNSLEEIFAGKRYQDFLGATWDERLDAYPFCRKCERSVSGKTEELIRVASWRIANLLQPVWEKGPLFAIMGEPRLAEPLQSFYQENFSECLPCSQFHDVLLSGRPAFLFIVAQGGAQIAYYHEAQKFVANLGAKNMRIIPILGAGFPQSQEIISSLADIYMAQG